eukprot:jgi/Chlat1/734/Chrsp104S00022
MVVSLSCGAPRMCILCSAGRLSRRFLAAASWVVAAAACIWALAHFYLFVLVSAVAAILLLIVTWFEFLQPWWRERLDRLQVESRLRRRLHAQEEERRRKEAVRRCRNCAAAYVHQFPINGRYTCSVCGHVSKRPMYDTDGSLEDLSRSRRGGSHGDERSYSSDMQPYWIWRLLQLLGKHRNNHDRDSSLRRKGSDDREESKEERARRKVEERRAARSEKQRLEDEERKQREEVARLVEEQRLARQRQEQQERLEQENQLERLRHAEQSLLQEVLAESIPQQKHKDGKVKSKTAKKHQDSDARSDSSRESCTKSKAVPEHKKATTIRASGEERNGVAHTKANGVHTFAPHKTLDAPSKLSNHAPGKGIVSSKQAVAKQHAMKAWMGRYADMLHRYDTNNGLAHHDRDASTHTSKAQLLRSQTHPATQAPHNTKPAWGRPQFPGAVKPAIPLQQTPLSRQPQQPLSYKVHSFPPSLPQPSFQHAPPPARPAWHSQPHLQGMPWSAAVAFQQPADPSAPAFTGTYSDHHSIAQTSPTAVQPPAYQATSPAQLPSSLWPDATLPSSPAGRASAWSQLPQMPVELQSAALGTASEQSNARNALWRRWHASDMLQAQPEYVDCVTQQVIQDPVITADSHAFERSAIELWLSEHDASPTNGDVLPWSLDVAADKSRPNPSMRSQLLAFRESLGWGRNEQLPTAPWAVPGTLQRANSDERPRLGLYLGSDTHQGLWTYDKVANSSRS